MQRLTDNDTNWGPFTIGRWGKRISAHLRSGECNKYSLLFVMFGWALRIWLPSILKPFKGGYPREFGFSLCDMGNGYDFLLFQFGPQTWDSSTTKSWSKHLPWKMWDCVRHSIYKPDGSHFATEKKGKWSDFYELKQECPASYFRFKDFDGEEITATCVIEECEWHRGEGWFRWLKYFFPAKIRRSLNLKFSAEVGPEKGSWKGGTIGHGVDMIQDETPEEAFKRYCGMPHTSRGNNYFLSYVGPCDKPDATR